MSKILAIKSVTTKAGRPVVLVSTVERDHWVPFGMWHAAGNDVNFEAYVGGSFDSSYFKKGDTLISGDVAQDDDIILERFSASMNPEVLAHMAAITSNKKGEGLLEAAAMFRKKAAADREAKKLAAEEAAKKAAGPVVSPAQA